MSLIIPDSVKQEIEADKKPPVNPEPQAEKAPPQPIVIPPEIQEKANTVGAMMEELMKTPEGINSLLTLPQGNQLVQKYLNNIVPQITLIS